MASCAKEGQEPGRNPEPFRIEASFDADVTKTVFDPSDNSVRWESTDALAVLVDDGASTKAYKFTKAADEGNAFECADFSPEEGKTYTYSLLYPYSSYLKSIGEDGYSNAYIEIPTAASSALVQAAVDDAAHVKGTLYARTAAEGTEMPRAAMSHLTHIFKARITNGTGRDLTVKKVSMTNDASQTLTGTYYINFISGDIKASGSNYVSETVNVNVADGHLPAGETGVVYVVTPGFRIPAGNSLTFKMTFGEGKAELTKTMESELVCGAGRIRTANLLVDADNFSGDSDMPAAYELVDDVAELKAGDKVVIAAVEYDYALSAVQNNNNRAQAPVVKGADNTLAFEDEAGVQVLTLEEGRKEGTWAFYTGEGYLYAASSSSNHLRTETELSDNGSWTVSISAEGVATITAQGTNTRNLLRYNSTSSLFSCYSSGQKDISIYRMPGGSSGEEEPPVQDQEVELGWLELPGVGAVATAKEYRLNVDAERNYTAYYDTETYSSLWIAYPLAEGHMGSYARPDEWTYYPGIEQSLQVNLTNRSYNDSYSRGHQIANADRNGNEQMQRQTFHVINSTPQIQNGFNGGIWAALEDKVRTAVPSGDTLYVVTGPVYRTVGGSETIAYTTAKDDTKDIPVANYFFKAVLKVKRSGTGITEAKAVGFWFDHKEYSDKNYEACAVTVDELETKTGYDFFVNLPDEIEAAAEANSIWTTFVNF